MATSEKVDSLLRNRTPWLAEITLLVLDEVHLIDDPSRGATLEMVVAKLRHKNPAMQIIALSATIGNPGDLAGWLDAELVESDWRPVDLREGLLPERYSLPTATGNRASEDEDLDPVLDTVEEGDKACPPFLKTPVRLRRAASG